MLSGHLDAFTTSGYVEGWALDDAPGSGPVLVAVTDAEGTELAWGYATVFRPDLATAYHKGGWCAFRLKLDVPPAQLVDRLLQLRERATGAVIVQAHSVRQVHEGPRKSMSSNIVAGDPTVIASVDQLAACDSLFDAFIVRNDLDAFVRTAYIYMLGRPADESGLHHYATVIEAGKLTPFGLLKALSESPEFTASSRLLAAPPSPAFPF